LHPDKQRKRGYNQSEYIARGIAEATGLTLVLNNLIKTVQTHSQTKKNRMERWTNVSDVFRVTNIKLYEGKHILLIDDTLTTGATLEACAQSLLSSCNCKVSVATLAYVK
jgi:predicted amidophosphoribosyltransferase